MTEEQNKIAERYSNAKDAFKYWGMSNSPQDYQQRVKSDVQGAQLKAELRAAEDAYHAMIRTMAESPTPSAPQDGKS